MRRIGQSVTKGMLPPYMLVMKQALRMGLAAGGAVAFVTAVAVAGKLSGWGPTDADRKATQSLAKSIESPSEDSPFKAGDPAPDFAVETLDGKTISLEDLKGKPIMLDFWATWCGPCVESLPDTERATMAFPNVTVLAVSGESRSTVEQFARDNPLQIRFCLEAGHAASDAYHVDAIPCRVFIDASGHVVDYLVGGGQEDAVAADLKKIDSVK